MTFTFKLERTDGAPADPPSIRSAVPDMRPGDTIPLSAGRTPVYSPTATGGTANRPSVD